MTTISGFSDCGQRYRLPAIGCLAHHREFGLPIHHQAQAGADQGVVVGQQDAGLFHAGIPAATGEREFGHQHSALSRRGLHGQRTAQAFDAFLHSEDAQAAGALRVEAASVVAHFDRDSTRAAGHAHSGVARPGVAHGIVESLLHQAIDADSVLVGQFVRHVLRFHRDLHPAAARDLAPLPLQGGNQPEIVEHGGTEQQRDVADGADGPLGERLHVVEPLANFNGIRGQVGRQPSEIHQQSAQRLADFVVQFARDGAALFLLRVHQAGGKTLQFVAALRQFAVASAGLPFEPQDVCHAGRSPAAGRPRARWTRTR